MDKRLEQRLAKHLAAYEAKGETALDLSGLELEELPQALKDFGHLRELDLSWNQVSDISVLQYLPNLTNLNLNFTEVLDISVLQDLPNLTNLGLSHTYVSDISVLQDLPNLTNLGLSHTQVSDISFLPYLLNLTNLDLSRTKVSDISILQHLPNLTNLDLSRTKVSDISVLQDLPNLTNLDLSRTKVSDILVLQYLPNLTNLNLHWTKVSDISVLQHLPNLTNLNLSRTQVSDISVLQYLPNLASLNLNWTQVLDISVLRHLSNLTALWLSNNEIEDIENLRYLSNLTELSLYNSNVFDISTIKCLFDLQDLSLGASRVEDLSALVGLQNLQRLDISDLKNLKASDLKALVVLPKLIHLDAKGAQSPELPDELFDSHNCLNDLREYFQHLDQEGYGHVYENKLLLLGEPKAGKTSLMRLLREPQGELCPEESTHGINLVDWEFPYENPKQLPVLPDFEGQFKARIFDFGGQDILQPSHRFFMRDRCVYVLVVDARKSEEEDYERWLQSIRYYGGEDCPLYILLNNHEKENMQAEVPQRWLEMFKVDGVYTVDLKNKVGLEEFRQVLKTALQSLPQVGQEKFLKTWVKLRNELIQKAQTQDTLFTEDYLSLSEDLGVQKKLANRTAIFLDALGDILYFHNNEELNHTIILRKEWATEASYQVFWSERIKSSLGLFPRDELAGILGDNKKFPKHQHSFILDLMRAFGVAYPVSGQDGVYIVPARLPINPPDAHKALKPSESLRFRLVFEGYMPKGLMSLFIVRSCALIHEKIQWKTGVVLDLQDLVRGTEPSLAEVEELRGELKQELAIRLWGERKREAASVLYKQYLLKVIEEMDVKKQLKPRLEVACPCIECKTAQEPHYFKYDHLSKLAKKGKTEVSCEKSAEDVNVKDLVLEFDLKESEKEAHEKRMEQSLFEAHQKLDSLHAKHDRTDEKVTDIQQKLSLFLQEYQYNKAQDSEDLEEAIQRLEALIDRRGERLLEKQKGQLEARFPAHAKLQVNSKIYLASGLYYLNTTPAASDFSAAALQLCRALELEMKTLCEGFKSTHHLNSYTANGDFSKLGKFVKGSGYLMFGDLKDIYERLKNALGTPPNLAPSSPDIAKDFYHYLSPELDLGSSHFAAFTDKLIVLTDKTNGTDYRNRAAHTGILTKAEAENCKDLVFEALEHFLALYKTV